MSIIFPNTRKFETISEYTKEVMKKKRASGSALVIMQNNNIVYEWYNGYHHFEPGARLIDYQSQFNVYSTRVTYVGLAAAIAINEGHFNLDDKLKNFFEDFDEDILGETTVRHLLSRSTGLKFEGNNVRRVSEVGSNIEGKRPDLITKIIYRQTGKTVAEIISEKIIKPLGWLKTEWATSGKESLVCDIQTPTSFPSLRIGSNIGDDRNLYVSARELAFWGNLHLNKGEIEGKQIIPKEVFDLTTTSQSPKTMLPNLPDFGFFWWIKQSKEGTSWKYNELGDKLPEGSFQILGASGCVCLVIPKYNTVAVRMLNSLYDNNFDYIKDIQDFGNMVMDIIGS